MIGFTGVHRDGFDDAHVEILKISNVPELQYFPLGVLRFFPNLIGFYLRRTGISRLNGNELLEYPQLQWFGLESGPLEFIPGKLFRSTPNMVSISFGGNKIKRVGKELLDNLKHLDRVYFLNNVCINMAGTSRADIEDMKEVLRRQCRSYD
jgi:hypothetical protein